MLRLKTPPDETWVWFTGLGLAVGLVMIAFLLSVIVGNGLAVFWPRDVVELRLSDPAQGVGGKPVVLGEVVKRQEKPVRVLDDRGKDTAAREWQLYTANRDAFGFSFLYVNESTIEGVSEPEGVMRLERMEYGSLLGYPVRFVLAEGEPLEAGTEAFQRRLQERFREVSRRRERIRELERDQIGEINRRIEDIRVEKGWIEQRRAPGTEEERLKKLEEQEKALQADYEVLAAEARRLRKQQEEDALVLRLSTGEERRIILGQIVDYYYPNRLGFLDKLERFFSGMWKFVWEEPREANTEGGVFPALFGTFVMTLLMSVAVMPFGVVAAVYLREYARQGLFVRAVRVAVNNLAGVPSIVFGVFGLGFFVYLVGGTLDHLFYPERLPTPTFGTGGILWASLTLALMTVPVVIVATEEALAAVPRGVREGSLACGASKWQTIRNVVLPASAPGILTGLILAMARGAGEVAPLMLVGVVKLAPTLPVDGVFPYLHLERKFMHLGFHIYDLGFQSPDSEAAKPMVFATALLLIMLVVVLNLGAILIRDRLRKKYAAGAF